MKLQVNKEAFWMLILTVFCVSCFPVNPLVLANLVEPGFKLPLFTTGWIVWAVGMGLVLTPVILFPLRGKVPRGKSFAYTTRLVDTGIYAIVRHLQYLGGILSIFIATPLLYPHWIFVVLVRVLPFCTGAPSKKKRGW